MHQRELHRHRHPHAFGTRDRTRAERRTLAVVALTVTTMAVEVVAGTIFGSMALLADGWHMATHGAALGLSLFAYAYARRHADDPGFSFGTGKVSALGGFASAVALGGVATLVLGESVWRLADPVTIHFDEALAVAVAGLVINLVSALLLREHRHPAEPGHHHHDHNLRAAYLHVLADALTSVLAIGALLAGKLAGWGFVDPLVGVLGAIVIGRWAIGLVRDSARVLLDAEIGPAERESLRRAIEADADNRVADLHVWRVGPRHLAAIVSVVTHDPRPPEHYKALLRDRRDLVHVTVEVHRCPSGPCSAA